MAGGPRGSCPHSDEPLPRGWGRRGRWIVTNGCTLSGCHEPPAAQPVGLRSLVCEPALDVPDVRDVPRTGERAAGQDGLGEYDHGVGDRPAGPGAADAIVPDAAATDRGGPSRAVNQAILSLLAQTVEVSQDPLLKYLYLEISDRGAGQPRVARRGHPPRRAVWSSQTRGEYGAKIAPLAGPDDYVRQAEADAPGRQADPGNGHAVGGVQAPERPVAQRHPAEAGPLHDVPRRLTAAGGLRVAGVFAAAGGVPAHQSGCQQVQDVREGRQFYLPSITEERR